jgi:outer membrane biosynthesis protein TonB
MSRWLIALSCAVIGSLACFSSSSAQQGARAPIHLFKKRLHEQIGRAWYHSVQTNSQKLALGTIRIAITASADGKITELRVLSNTSNELMAQISLAAIRQAKIPPIPPELLSDGKFQDQVSFTMFPNSLDLTNR